MEKFYVSANPETGALLKFQQNNKTVLEVRQTGFLANGGMAQVFLGKLGDKEIVLRKIMNKEEILQIIIESVYRFMIKKHTYLADISNMYLYNGEFAATLYVIMVC
jgi:hypothetical protein